MYSSTREKVQAELKGVIFFSATTDLWSSEALHPYISYTVHYIDHLWQYHTRCLQTAFLPSDHTGENLADALETALATWGLNVRKQVCITTDSGANIVRACSLLGWQRLACFGHNLNLAVNKALKDDHRVSRALALARKIVSSFSTSWKRRRELKRVQSEKNLPEHSLIGDCPTRWGSIESMVSRFLEQEEAVRLVLSSDRKTTHLIPTWQDTEVLESLSKALSPVAELTDLLSGEEHITISSIIPILHNLRSRILAEQQDDSALTKDIKRSILVDLEACYCDPKTNELLSIATFLDPRFKMQYAENQDHLKAVIEEQAKEFYSGGTEQDQDMSLCSSMEVTEVAEQPLSKKKKLAHFLQKVSEEPELSPRDRVLKEITAYLSSPELQIESEVSPLSWWQEHAQHFSILAQLANKWLCICATSCSSERLFSTSGHVVTPARSSLNPDKVNMLVFLAKNL